MNDTNKNQQSTASKFASRGMFVGVVIGVVGGSIYAMSDLNPSKGGFLSLETNLILIGCPFVGASLGHIIGKLSDSQG